MADAYTETLEEVTADVSALLAQTLEEALLAQYLSQITGPVSKAATDRARALAKEAASSLLRDFTKTQLNSMGEAIATGLEQGKGPREIARMLTDVQGLDPQRAARLEKVREYLESSDLSNDALEKAVERERQKLLRDRRETIARTEARKATSEAREVEALGRGAKWKHWITTADERLCDICSGNEGDGVIPVEDSFSGGTMTAPAHPNCRCSVAYVTTDRGRDIAERLNERNKEETATVRAEAGK